MGNETGQLDIPGIQLRESRTQPKVSHSREIGEAEIIHTIFGKAKVRINRKHDKLRHALLLTATFGVAATSTFVVQSWYVAQQQESSRLATPMAPVSVVQDVVPASQPEVAAASAIPPAATLVSVAPPPQPVPPGVPQPQAVKPAPVPVPPKPPVAVPAQAVVLPARPVTQTPPPAAAPKAPTVAAPAAKPTVPKPPAASAVVAPSEAKPAVQPTASSPAAAPRLDAPVIKDGSSEVDNHLSAPISLQRN